MRKTRGNQVPDVFSNKSLTQVTFEDLGGFIFLFLLFFPCLIFHVFGKKILIAFEQTGDHKTPPNKLGFNLHQNIKREINTRGLVILTFGQ